MELFQIPVSESPRRLWLKKHRISTHKSDCFTDDDEPWNAWVGELSEAIEDNLVRTGATEDDALCDLAKKLGIRLWNEVLPTATPSGEAPQ
jgi:hypothetical protein